MNVLRRHIWIFVITVLLAVGALIGWSIYQSKYSLTCTSYRMHTDAVQAPVRIVQITDLHNSTFGENNQKLIDLTAEQSPDLILMTGALLNSDDPRTDLATDLISDLCSIAPVYVSLGNHEIEYRERFDMDIVKLYENITVNGQTVRLGGIYGYCPPAKYLEIRETDSEECTFLTEFQNTDAYTILMCHMPVCWLINDRLDEWDVDCVFSDHVDGGQIILPLFQYLRDAGIQPLVISCQRNCMPQSVPQPGSPDVRR